MLFKLISSKTYCNYLPKSRRILSTQFNYLILSPNFQLDIKHDEKQHVCNV